MGFIEKLTNVFASPGEVFDNVRLAPRSHSNWVIPWLLFAIVAVVLGQLVIHDSVLVAQFSETIQKNFDKSVAAGKMTQDQADKAFEFARPGSFWFTLAQVVGSVFIPLIGIFLFGLVFWLLGRTAMNATAPYMKVVEVMGLCLFIGILEQIVTTLMMIALGSIHATPSLGLFVSPFDTENKVHLALAKVNVFTFWYLGVVSVGLARIFQRDFPKVLVLVVALWLVWTIASLLLGFSFGG